MTTLIRTFLAALSITIMGSLAFIPAHAGDARIEAAQKAGTVGERIDGYLGIVDQGVDDATRRRVNEINAQRRALYAKLSKDSGVPIEQVARLTGEKQVAKAAPGEFIMGDSGGWTQK
ncbi:MAG: YdbL family protein [Pseudomonadota bacterium]